MVERQGSRLRGRFLAIPDPAGFSVIDRWTGEPATFASVQHTGKNSGGNGYWWVYFVNGTAPNVGAGAYMLKDGDSVAWDYKHVASGLKQAPHPGL